jgi:hypothetical protein
VGEKYEKDKRKKKGENVKEKGRREKEIGKTGRKRENGK